MSSFQFNGKKYEYFDHTSNQTRVNERRVELPLAFEFVEKNRNIIEIGNVTHHYKRHYTHDVLDLFEKVPWWPIINKDVLMWKPEKKYNAALSISTLEHIVDPISAVRRVLSFAPCILITIPVGYNNIDKVIESFPEVKMDFMHRVSEDNLWEQCSKEVAKKHIYNSPFLYGNAIIIIQR